MIEIVTELTEGFCSVCGLLIAHEKSGGRCRVWTPIEHCAPECGRPCLGGGVSNDAYNIGLVLHRFECCECDEDLQFS